MKILVFSDSHSSFSFMRRCIEVVQPDAMIHLGDYYSDGQTMAEEYPNIPIYQVPGNCDAHRGYIPDPETQLISLHGVRLFMTHGHRHGVKMSIYKLLADARSVGVQAVLFGHTHMALCQQDEGIWVLNPGPATYGGSAGIIEIHCGKITHCRLIRPDELMER